MRSNRGSDGRWGEDEILTVNFKKEQTQVWAGLHLEGEGGRGLCLGTAFSRPNLGSDVRMGGMGH